LKYSINYSNGNINLQLEGGKEERKKKIDRLNLSNDNIKFIVSEEEKQ